MIKNMIIHGSILNGFFSGTQIKFVNYTCAGPSFLHVYTTTLRGHFILILEPPML